MPQDCATCWYVDVRVLESTAVGLWGASVKLGTSAFPTNVRIDNERDMPETPRFAHRDGMLLIDTGPSRAGGHQMEMYETCPRMYRLMKMPVSSASVEPQSAGVKLPERFYLERGSLVHIGLAHYHTRRALKEQGRVQVAETQYTRDDVERFYEPLEAVHVAAHASADRRRTLRESEKFVERYIAWQDEYPVPWVVLGIEVEVGINLIEGGELYTARLDLLAKSKLDGKIYSVDHKTAYSPGDAARMYGHSWQMLGVQEIGRERFGALWGGIQLNVINTGGGSGAPVSRVAPAVAPALAGNWREHAIRYRQDMRQSDKLPISQVPFRLCSCWRPREGLCPMYDLCGIYRD